jgi:hypothetical protein
MNANELADELQACFTKADWEYVNECAAMLRQQQAEIEALKERLRPCQPLCKPSVCICLERNKRNERK